jgi:hypothetical protein
VTEPEHHFHDVPRPDFLIEFGAAGQHTEQLEFIELERPPRSV